MGFMFCYSTEMGKRWGGKAFDFTSIDFYNHYEASFCDPEEGNETQRRIKIAISTAIIHAL